MSTIGGRESQGAAGEREHDGWRVETEPGLKILYGVIPLDSLAQALSGAPDDWVLDAGLAQLIGATFVCGAPGALAEYRKRAVPGARRRAEMSAALNAGLTVGALTWILSGDRGRSADALFTACVPHVPLTLETGAVPSDGADFNRCALLQAAVPECSDVSAVATASPKWAALARAWDALLAARSEDLAHGTGWARTTAVLRAAGLDS